MKSIIKDKNIFRLLVVLLIVFIVSAWLNPKVFLSAYNFKSMAKQFPELGLLALGIGLTLLLGGIDLSAVSIANLSAIFSATFMIRFMPQDPSLPIFGLYMVLILLISVTVGSCAGAVNGLLITKIGIPPILATLGTQQLFTGLAIVYTGGKAISGLPIGFSNFINGNLFLGIPVILVIFLLIFLLFGIFLSKSPVGKRLYLIGTNPVASEYAGLKTNRLVILTYALSGALAAVAGLIMMGKSNSIKADYGASYTLQCILIAVLGGFNPKGGKGRVLGILIAVLILQFMSTSLNMFSNISNFYRDLIWGGLLLIVLLANYYFDRRKGK